MKLWEYAIAPDGTWPLAEGAQPCVGSGLCCKTARCQVGVEKHGPGRDCPSLRERDGRYWCGEIEDADEAEAARLREHLYVGAGCCMPLFNEVREAILRKLRRP